MCSGKYCSIVVFCTGVCYIALLLCVLQVFGTLHYYSVWCSCLVHCTTTVCVAGVWYIALLQCVVQVFGGPGSGKTQLCLTASALCALGGGRVAFIDTRGGLDTVRLHQVGRLPFS